MRQENASNTDNPTVYNRLRRYDLSESYDPPHKGENATVSNRKKFGTRKARHKNHRRESR